MSVPSASAGINWLESSVLIRNYLHKIMHIVIHLDWDVERKKKNKVCMLTHDSYTTNYTALQCTQSASRIKKHDCDVRK